MKKFMAMFLSLILVMSMLAGCGGNANTTTAAGKETGGSSTGDGPTVGICIYQFTDNFMTLYRTYLQETLETKYNAKVTVADGKNDQAEQTNQIENFITQGVDILIINLVQATAAEQITDKCNEAGIPVVFINREPDEAELARWEANTIKATYVGADARQSGTYQGEIVLDLADQGDINKDGTIGYVMIMGDVENVDAQYRTEFSVKALTDAGKKVDEVDLQRGDWDQARGQELVANALSAYGDDVEVVFCNNDAMALGAAQAIEAAGRTVGKDIYLLGVDALTEALEKVLDGSMTGTVFNDHVSQADKAVEAAMGFYNGTSVDYKYTVDYVKVTKDNAQEILDLLK